jgi:cell fate regulator YaaT (PSP1 superfamily)
MIEIVKVRLREGGKIQDYDANGLVLKLGEQVIVPTPDGQALGTVVSNPQRLDEEYIKATFRRVVRKATEEDVERVRRQQEEERAAYQYCQRAIGQLGLPMKLVAVEHLFEGGKAIFYFTAEGRVDFRQLVKELARECRIRIEMRQIGVRDEARMVGGYGICGRELCCASFLSEFEPISIRMAKDQDLPLSPGKVSGVCSRLMCCLGYENRVYDEFKQGLPKIGEKVRLHEGLGRVRKYNIFEDSFTVELEGGEFLKVSKKDWNRGGRDDEHPHQSERPPAPEGGEQRPREERPTRPEERSARPEGGGRRGGRGRRRPEGEQRGGGGRPERPAEGRGRREGQQPPGAQGGS